MKCHTLRGQPWSPPPAARVACPPNSGTGACLSRGARPAGAVSRSRGWSGLPPPWYAREGALLVHIGEAIALTGSDERGILDAGVFALGPAWRGSGIFPRYERFFADEIPPRP